jgi:hypothetical protein
MTKLWTSKKMKILAFALCLPAMAMLISVWPSVGQAKAPDGRYTVNTDTVYDNVTKLTWPRLQSDQLIAWLQASSYCQTLDLNGTGWRLPTIFELESIIDFSQYNWALDPSAFTKPQTPLEDRFWASTQDAFSPTSAWSVDFYHGNSSTQSKTGTFYVRCVR